MAHYGWLRWYIQLIQRLTALTYLAPTLQSPLWPDEVQFGLAASTTSQRHIVLVLAVLTSELLAN